MTKDLTAAKLLVLTVRAVLSAADGDHSVGDGLLLRVRGESASWVLRYSSPGGRRREMGLGVVLRANTVQAEVSLTAARDATRKARELLRHGTDPSTNARSGGTARACLSNSRRSTRRAST